MKYLITLLILMLLMSCTEPTYENSAEDMTFIEVEALLSTPMDTIQIVQNENGKIIYRVENNRIVAQYQLKKKGSVNHHIMYGDLIILACVIAIIFLIIGGNLD